MRQDATGLAPDHLVMPDRRDRRLPLRSLMRLTVAAVPIAVATPAVAQDYATRLLRVPAAQSVAGNQERFVVLPSVNLAYETNALPYSNRGTNTDEGSNLRVTPGIDISYNRQFGRTKFTLAGSGGYDLNTKYKFLNQPRINVSAAVTQPVGGRCSVDARAFYQQSRFSQFDFVQGNDDDATSKTQVYDANFACNRPVGFSPVVGATYSRQSTDGFAIFTYTTFSYRGGVSYVKPSLGVLTLSASRQELRRPEIKRLIGIGDGTDVTQVSLSLSRGVSPRLNFTLGGGYFWADPQRPGLASSSGPSYNGAVTYLPSTRLRFSAFASRDITNEGGISATYVRRDAFSLSSGYTLSARSNVSVTGSVTYRDFTGEDVANAVSPIGRDRVASLGVGYSLDFLRSFRFGAGVSHIWRNGRNDFYDYQSTIVTASIGARF